MNTPYSHKIVTKHFMAKAIRDAAIEVNHELSENELDEIVISIMKKQTQNISFMQVFSSTTELQPIETMITYKEKNYFVKGVYISIFPSYCKFYLDCILHNHKDATNELSAIDELNITAQVMHDFEQGKKEDSTLEELQKAAEAIDAGA